MGGATQDNLQGQITILFQSTLPVWGATPACSGRSLRPCNFNPRSPCGERLAGYPLVVVASWISIHAPRVGSDSLFLIAWSGTIGFQSTLPVWGATSYCQGHYPPDIISIHAPRVGSDNVTLSPSALTYHFNPRSPCGERPFGGKFGKFFYGISIHAPRVGSDGRRSGAR